MAKEQILKVDPARKSVKLGVWVFEFKSGDHHIAFIPSLNLTGYGPTSKEALEMLFEDILPDMCDHLVALPEHAITKELAKYGWKRSLVHKKHFRGQSYLDADGVLKNFNLPAETKISREFIAA